MKTRITFSHCKQAMIAAKKVAGFFLVGIIVYCVGATLKSEILNFDKCAKITMTCSYLFGGMTAYLYCKGKITVETFSVIGIMFSALIGIMYYIFTPSTSIIFPSIALMSLISSAYQVMAGILTAMLAKTVLIKNKQLSF